MKKEAITLYDLLTLSDSQKFHKNDLDVILEAMNINESKRKELVINFFDMHPELEIL